MCGIFLAVKKTVYEDILLEIVSIKKKIPDYRPEDSRVILVEKDFPSEVVNLFFLVNLFGGTNRMNEANHSVVVNYMVLEAVLRTHVKEMEKILVVAGIDLLVVLDYLYELSKVIDLAYLLAKMIRENFYQKNRDFCHNELEKMVEGILYCNEEDKI